MYTNYTISRLHRNFHLLPNTIDKNANDAVCCFEEPEFSAKENGAIGMWASIQGINFPFLDQFVFQEAEQS